MDKQIVGNFKIWGTDLIKDGDTYTAIKTGGWTPQGNQKVLIKGKSGELADVRVVEIIDKDTFAFTTTTDKPIMQFWGFGFHTDNFYDKAIERAVEAEDDENTLVLVKAKYDKHAARKLYQLGADMMAKRLLDF